MSNGILIIAIILLFMIAYFLIGGSTEEVSYVESFDNDIINQRVKMLCKSVDMIWNSLVIDKWLEADGKTSQDVETEVVLFNDNILTAYSLYAERGFKLTCELNWRKQLLRVRIEQQLNGSVIQVVDKVAIDMGVISILQAEQITDKYFEMIEKILSQINNQQDSEK